MPDNPDQQLRDLWRTCFPDVQALRANPAAMADAERNWESRRAEHLPLTLAAVVSPAASLTFGGSDQTSGEPVLLLLAGFSPEQLALVAALNRAAGCARIVPVSPVAAWNVVQPDVADCLRDLGVTDVAWEALVPVEAGEPTDVFRKVLAWVRGNPAARVAIDCTGGKKPMDSGAAHAASFYGLPARYLDFEEYDPVLRRPRPWALRYRSLDLPDAAFSLPSRARAAAAWRGRRFAEVGRAVAPMLDDAAAGRFLDEEDRDDIRRVCEDAARADAWLSGGYGRSELRGHPLHSSFSGRAGRVVMNDLLAGSHDTFFRYAADECWRLLELAEAGVLGDALVGAVGLVETVVERLVFLALRTGAKVQRAEAREWLGVDGPPDLPDISAWTDQAVPYGCLPPSSFGPKLKLLRKSAAEFDVWAWPQDGGAVLRPPSPAHDQPRLSARVAIGTSGPLLPNASNRIWKDLFGDFPHGAWVQLRHAHVHLRAPLGADDEPEARRAVECYAPRFIELLHRLQALDALDLANAKDEGWLSWTRTSPWTREESVPWHGREGEVEHELRLRLSEGA